jgi:hypothetical protein
MDPRPDHKAIIIQTLPTPRPTQRQQGPCSNSPIALIEAVTIVVIPGAFGATTLVQTEAATVVPASRTRKTRVGALVVKDRVPRDNRTSLMTPLANRPACQTTSKSMWKIDRTRSMTMGLHPDAQRDRKPRPLGVTGRMARGRCLRQIGHRQLARGHPNSVSHLRHRRNQPQPLPNRRYRRSSMPRHRGGSRSKVL